MEKFKSFIKGVKRNLDARAKSADHFDRASDPKNPNKSKDLRRAVKYHNVVHKEDVNEALDTHAMAMAHKDKASKALETSDMKSYHNHMSNHHESMGQWHESKGRHSAADREYAKAEEHHEKSLKPDNSRTVGVKKEAFDICPTCATDPCICDDSHGFVSEESMAKHKVAVTVSDPNHTAVSQRKDKVLKNVIVRASDEVGAKEKATEFYKKKGYKVHSSEYHSQVNEGENKQIKGGDPCWKGYQMVGMKPGKGGRKVPNCVPATNESMVPAHMMGKQKPYVSSDGKGGHEVLGNTGQVKATFTRKEHGKDAKAKAIAHLQKHYDTYMKEDLKSDLKSFLAMIEEASYRVDVEGLPTMYVQSDSPTEVKSNLRRILKKADMIKSVDRIPDADVKKAFRLKAMGKDEE